MHDTPPTTEDVITGDNSALENVVVYLKGDFNAYKFPPASTPVTIDQKGCMYVPHVIAIETGAPLRIHNSDSASHNSNTLTKVNSPWNETQPVGGAPVERSFSHPEVAIALKCNIHPWMKAYVAVLPYPYFQVTGADGSFTLKNVPPGTYTLTAWQERYGTREQVIQVTPKSEQQVTISYKAS
jgi:plastocyanin